LIPHKHIYFKLNLQLNLCIRPDKHGLKKKTASYVGFHWVSLILTYKLSVLTGILSGLLSPGNGCSLNVLVFTKNQKPSLNHHIPFYISCVTFIFLLILVTMKLSFIILFYNYMKIIFI
jgi:hypothetical protein